MAGPSIQVRVQEQDFDPTTELAVLQAARSDIGAIASFLGLVRAGEGEGGVVALTLEHYPGMTERAIVAMAHEAARRFPGVLGMQVLHRVGRLDAGARIVWVAVAAAHRREAFEACEFLMDYLKTQAPFWKKAHGPQGTHWVDARAADDLALARWGVVSDNAGSAPST